MTLVVVFVMLPRAPSRVPATVTATLTWSHVLADTGDPIAQSSPIVATLDGAPAAVVGDRAGNVYAFDLADGSSPPRWPVSTGGVPVDATPSAWPATGGGGDDDIYVSSGNAADPDQGGYQAYAPTGTMLWFTQVVNPATDGTPDQGVQASPTVTNLQGVPAVVAGSLGQEAYALNAGNGSTLAGWPFFTSDSVFSTAAVGDLYGTGHNEIVEGGDQTAGFGRDQLYQNGGHIRVFNQSGGLICHDDTDQTVDSSPAVGGFLRGGAAGIAVGTGGYFAGASSTDALLALDSRCAPAWSDHLDGITTSSPALADLTGDGSLAVVEGTDNGSASGVGGSVWAVSGATGSVLWQQPVQGRVIGSVVTADVSGSGYQDVVVATTAGAFILDGRTGQEVAQLQPANAGCPAGFQNAPLITQDPNGSLGITLAGYNCNNQGVVEHYELSGGSATEPGSWPMFHHDPMLSGNAGGLPSAGSIPACGVPSSALGGYDLIARDGGLFSFGAAPFCGSPASLALRQPVVGMAEDPLAGGYWLVAADGGVFAYGDAPFYGSMGGRSLDSPVIGMAATPDGRGYWLVAADGGIFGFGDAQFFGSMGGRRLNAPVVGMVTDVDTGGYWLLAADGGVFNFEAPFFGSMGGLPLAAPIVGGDPGPNGGGYRMVAADGGVFGFGDAPYAGSMGGRPLNAPIVAMSSTA